MTNTGGMTHAPPKRPAPECTRDTTPRPSDRSDGPCPEILAQIVKMDLPVQRKAEAMVAYLKACGWDTDAP